MLELEFNLKLIKLVSLVSKIDGEKFLALYYMYNVIYIL